MFRLTHRRGDLYQRHWNPGAGAVNAMHSFSFLMPWSLFKKWMKCFKCLAFISHFLGTGTVLLFYVHISPFSGLQKLLVKGTIVSFLFPSPVVFSPTHKESAFWGYKWFGGGWADWTSFHYKTKPAWCLRVDWKGILRWPGQEGSGKRTPEKSHRPSVMWLYLLYRLQAYLLTSKV